MHYHREKNTTKEHKETFGVMSISIALSVVTVSWVYAYVQIDQTMYT